VMFRSSETIHRTAYLYALSKERINQTHSERGKL